MLIALLLQTTTVCTPVLGQVQCTTNGANPMLNQAWQGYQQSQQDLLRSNERAQERAREARMQQRQADLDAMVADQRAQQTREDRIAALVAQGKCEDASRLAQFYGDSALIAKTAGACKGN